MTLKKDFLDFLGEKFMDNFHGSKDDYEDAFDIWLQDLDGQELIDYADEFGASLVEGAILNSYYECEKLTTYTRALTESKDQLMARYFRE